MFYKQFLMPVIAVLTLCGITVAQKTPGNEGIGGAKTFKVIVDDSRLEMANYLGVATTTAPAALREQLKLKPGIGLIVEHVDQGSPAEQAGLKQYDIIEKFDDQWMVNTEQLAVLIRMAEPNREIKLAIIRQTQAQILSAKLTEKARRPAISDFSGAGDSSTGWRLTGRGSATVEADPKNPGAMRIYMYNNPKQTGQMRVSSTSGDYDLTLTRENNKTHLSAVNQADKSPLDRDLNSEQDLNDLPPELGKRIRQLLSTMKITLPTTLPAAQ